MRVLYVYPHPDDESFGPAHVMHRHRREGHDVYLLTLTRGGATRQRFKYDYTVDRMGEVRLAEMLDVEKALNLSGMTVLDLPDSGLKEMDPRDIEKVVREGIEAVEPNVIVSYPVHGISGFHDHLVTHAVIKRVFLEMKPTHAYLKRLAFITLFEDSAAKAEHFRLSGSTDAEIDCIIESEEVDRQAHLAALDCYTTFQETIDKSGVRDHAGTPSPFEFFQESLDPPLTDLFEELP